MPFPYDNSLTLVLGEKDHFDSAADFLQRMFEFPSHKQNEIVETWNVCLVCCCCWFFFLDKQKYNCLSNNSKKSLQATLTSLRTIKSYSE